MVQGTSSKWNSLTLALKIQIQEVQVGEEGTEQESAVYLARVVESLMQVVLGCSQRNSGLSYVL